MIAMLLGASLTINIIFMISWKLLVKSMRKELSLVQQELEKKYITGGK